MRYGSGFGFVGYWLSRYLYVYLRIGFFVFMEFTDEFFFFRISLFVLMSMKI